jgi:hypothetical protein
MPTPNARYLLLIVVLTLSVGAAALVGGPSTPHPLRVPDADELRDRALTLGWSAHPATRTDHGDGTAQLEQVFRAPDGRTATLTVFTQRVPKLYGAGAEVPFLGTGYSILPAPAALALARPELQTLLARRGDANWLVVAGYGEQRGLSTAGPGQWGLALFDSLAGRPNDYFKVYLVARVDPADAMQSQQVTQLATALVDDVTAFYAVEHPR